MNWDLWIPAAGVFLFVMAVTACGYGGATERAAYVPGRTLSDDLARLKLGLVEGYTRRRPRLLFYAEDKARLRAKKATAPGSVWGALLGQAGRLGGRVPNDRAVREGRQRVCIALVHVLVSRSALCSL